MLADLVKCTVASPGIVNVGSTLSLGAVPTGYQSFLAAFGATNPSYFALSDGIGRTITGVWTVNAGGTATITEILWNFRTGTAGTGDTFSTTCTAWCPLPAAEIPLPRDTPFAGLRNAIINGNPIINQRAYVSGAATSGANQYTLDRWRVVTSGQAVSWTDSAGVRTVTAPAGGMEQVIEGSGLFTGTYTINWTGTATCTVGGSAVTKGQRVSVTGGADLTVRMTGGTWGKLQLEPGKVATPFEIRPLALEHALCDRYFQRISQLFYLWNSTTRVAMPIGFPLRARMRATPTAAVAASSSNVNLWALSVASADPTAAHIIITNDVAGGVQSFVTADLTAEF